MRRVWAAIVIIGLAAGSVVGVGSAASAADPLAVSISGSTSLGSTLTAVVTGGDGTTPAYQWLSNGNVIAGSTAVTYAPALADRDDEISVRATDSNGPVTSAAVRINAGSLVMAQPSVTAGSSVGVYGSFFAPGVAYLISADAYSQAVTADANGQFSATVPYAADAAIGTHTISALAPVGKIVSTTVVVARPPSNPVMAATAPAITGKVQVGVTVEVVLGTWTPGTTFTYRWLLGGKAISGATGPRYAIKASDVGHSLRVRVVGTADAATVTATSDAQTVAHAPFLTQPTVSIKGTLKKGHKLKVVTGGAWLPAPTSATYAWYVNGKQVGTGKTITVKKSWKKKHVTVRLTAKRAGYTTTVRSYTTAKKVS